MKQCPSCKAANDAFQASGPLVWGTASVVYGEDGSVRIGAIVPKVVIKKGAEFRERSQCTLICPTCGARHPIDDFVNIVPCAFNKKKVGNNVMTFADGVQFYVCDDYKAQAEALLRLAASLAEKKDNPYEEFNIQ